MDLVFRQIEEVVKINDKQYVLCRIHVVPREIYFYKGQNKPYISHRWMCEVDWAAFDMAIERLINSGFEEPKTVVLSPNPIRLDVERINGDALDSFNGFHVTKVLKCKIEFVNASNEYRSVASKNDNNEHRNLTSIESDNLERRKFTINKSEDSISSNELPGLIGFTPKKGANSKNVTESSKEKEWSALIDTGYSPNSVAIESDDDINESEDNASKNVLKDIIQSTPKKRLCNNIKFQSSSEQDYKSTTASECVVNNVENSLITTDFKKGKGVHSKKLLKLSSRHDRNASMEVEISSKDIEKETNESLNEDNEKDNSIHTRVFNKDTPEKGGNNKNSSKYTTEKDCITSFEMECSPNNEEMEIERASNASKSHSLPDLTVFINTDVERLSNKNIFQLSGEIECSPVAEVEYSPNKDRMEISFEGNDYFNENDDSKNTLDPQKINQKTPKKRIVSKKLFDKCRVNETEMETSDAFTYCKENTDLEDDIEKVPEKVENDNKCQESKTQEVSPQTGLRPARTLAKPKRYNNDDYVSKKRLKCSYNNESKSKPLLKNNPKSVRNIQKKPAVASIIQKFPMTPKSCSKQLFRNTNTKWHINTKMQDLYVEFSSQWQRKKPLLTLDDVTLDRIMESLESIRSELDVLFQKVYHKGHVKSYEGIDHYLVIDLLPNEIQKAMMTKLSDLYETGDAPKYATHFANVLMPEWILSIFMTKYNMTREESIARLREQNSCYIKPNDPEDQKEDK